MAPLISISQGKAAPRPDEELENYNVDDSDDPFASPPPAKSKEPAGLGIDEEVVQKRARVPRVKLDETRLLGPTGIPKLRQRARDLKIKGKGHEFSDAARLLSFYQLWLDDMFPKAKFLDALAMVEKAGHKKSVMAARNEWLNEGKPRDKTPQSDEQEQEQDIYDATPKKTADVPAEDDLDALIAEAEGQDEPADNDDDLDALIAEAEMQDAPARPTTTEADFADEEAAMEEMDGSW